MRQVSQQTHCTRLGLLSGSVANGPVYGGLEVQIWVGREKIWWGEKRLGEGRKDLGGNRKELSAERKELGGEIKSCTSRPPYRSLEIRGGLKNRMGEWEGCKSSFFLTKSTVDTSVALLKEGGAQQVLGLYQLRI